MSIKGTNYQILFVFTVLFIVSIGCNNTKIEEETKEGFPVLTGKYIGQIEPGLKPEIFAANIVSPDGKYFFYASNQSMKSADLHGKIT